MTDQQLNTCRSYASPSVQAAVAEIDRLRALVEAWRPFVRWIATGERLPDWKEPQWPMSAARAALAMESTYVKE